MNDFTKDELISIWRCVSPVLIGDIAFPLKEKIQSMIDNYCEHETDAGGCGGEMIYRCKKCGLFYRYD